MEGEEEERLVQAAQYDKLDVLQAFHLGKGVAAHGSKSHALTHDTKDWAGDTLLSIACWHGHRAVCEFLMDLGADVNSRNSNLNTPLHRAAYKGDLDIVSLLIDRGSDVTAKDSFGRRACDMADSKTRTLLMTVATMKTFEDAQRAAQVHDTHMSMQRRSSVALRPGHGEEDMEVVMLRRKRAVAVVLRHATNTRLNGAYEPVDRHNDGWPVYSKRGRERRLWLLYLAASNEWLVLDNPALNKSSGSGNGTKNVVVVEPDRALLRIHQTPANFPELRVNADRDGVSEPNTQRGFFDWYSAPAFVPSGAEVVTEAEVLASRANDALRSQMEVGLGLGSATQNSLVGLGMAARRRSSVQNEGEGAGQQRTRQAPSSSPLSPDSDTPMLSEE